MLSRFYKSDKHAKALLQGIVNDTEFQNRSALLILQLPTTISQPTTDL